MGVVVGTEIGVAVGTVVGAVVRETPAARAGGEGTAGPARRAVTWDAAIGGPHGAIGAAVSGDQRGSWTRWLVQ